MAKRNPDLKLIQQRVANYSIGSSALRNQGALGMVEIARAFLANLNLTQFKNITERQFRIRLEKFTQQLKIQFPIEARRNWGAARKSMNVFLENAFYNIFLNNEYNLHKLKEFLEVPLDSYVGKGLRRDFRKSTFHYKLPVWKGIRQLNSE